MLKLLYSPLSPYARKVRVVAAEKKIALELIVVDPWNPDPLLLKMNPLSKIPALILEDGSSLFDSRVIVEYLDGLSPIDPLIPTLAKDRIAVKRWEVLADGLCDAAILARVEGMRPDQTESSAKLIVRQRGKIAASLKEMSEQLGENHYCVGNALTLADIALACALGYLNLRFPDIQWAAAHKNLATFYKNISETASFISTEPSPA